MSYFGQNRKCKNCGGEIDWRERSDKETCSDACRKAWSRRSSNVKKEWTNALRALSRLRRMLKDYPDLANDINGKIEHIKSECSDLLLVHPSRDTQDKFEMLEGHFRSRS